MPLASLEGPPEACWEPIWVEVHSALDQLRVQCHNQERWLKIGGQFQQPPVAGVWFPAWQGPPTVTGLWGQITRWWIQTEPPSPHSHPQPNFLGHLAVLVISLLPGRGTIFGPKGSMGANFGFKEGIFSQEIPMKPQVGVQTPLFIGGFPSAPDTPRDPAQPGSHCPLPGTSGSTPRPPSSS